MSDFAKPLLPDETPEPPILEQKAREEAQKQARMSLAGIPGAARAAEDAGLGGKPAPPVDTLRTTRKKPAGFEIEARQPDRTSASKAGEAKPRNPAKAPPKPVPPKDIAAPMPDRDWQLRQAALQDVLAGMRGTPDADAMLGLFKLFLAAPDKENDSAALVIAMTFLRCPATARAPLMKALAPALRTYRGSPLAVLLARRLGHVVASQPSAPVPATPGA